MSSSARALPAAVSVADATAVLLALRALGSHRFLVDDASLVDEGAVQALRSRNVTDAHLLTLARRHGTELVTFDAGTSALAGGQGVHLLRA